MLSRFTFTVGGVASVIVLSFCPPKFLLLSTPSHNLADTFVLCGCAGIVNVPLVPPSFHSLFPALYCIWYPSFGIFFVTITDAFPSFHCSSPIVNPFAPSSAFGTEIVVLLAVPFPVLFFYIF